MPRGIHCRIFSQLKHRGLTPTFQKCDNECPKAFKTFLTKHGIAFQLAPPTITALTRPKKPSTHSSATSSPGCPASTPRSPSTCGAASSPTHCSPSTFYAALTFTRNYLPRRTLTALSTSMLPPSPRLVVAFWDSNPGLGGVPGHPMASSVGTSGPPANTTDATASTSHPPAANVST